MLTSDSIRLGVMPPLTGLVAMYGQEITWAAQIACQEVNESGGVLGRPLELFIEDDGSLPESAVSAAKKLVDQHRCVAIIGNLLSNSRIAVAYRVAEPCKIPYLNFSFYEGSISSRYFFHFAALPNQQIDKMIPYMQKLYGPKMFFAGNNYEWPRGSIDAAKRVLEKSNGKVVGEEYYPIGISPGDIDKLLDNVSASGADVFVPYFAGIDQVHLLVAFTARGLKKRMAVVMGHYDEVMVSHLPPEVREGFYSSNTYFMSVDTLENRSYLDRLNTMPGITGIWPQGNGILTNFGEGTYLCVKAFAQAANQAGSVEPEALINALETISLTGPQGIVKMDSVTHHAKVNTYLSCCQADGTFKIIEHFGTIDPLIPERYRHWQMSGQTHLDEDIRIQARMLEQMTEAVFLVDAKDGTIVYTNPSSERMFGYSRGELIGKHVPMLNAPSDKTPEEIAADINSILYRKGVWRGEIRNIKKDGSTFWGSVSVSAFTHARYGEVWMSVYKDISERKQAEESLQNMATKFRTMFESSSDAIMLLDEKGFFDCNSATLRMFGGPERDDFISKHPSQLSPPTQPGGEDSMSLANQRIAMAFKNGSNLFEWIHRRVDGADFPAEVLLTKMELNGKPVLQATVRDITERKLAEATRMQLAAIVESSNDAIIGKTPDGIITSWNKGAEAIYGYTADEIIGKPTTTLAPPAHHAEMHELLEKIRKGGTVVNHESERIRKDGVLIHVSLTISPIKDVSGNITGISTIARDITEKKRMEEELLHASVYTRSLIEASMDPLVTISPEGKITDVNDGSIKVTGVSREKLIGTDFSDYFTEPEKARAGYQQVFAKGFVTDYPLTIRHTDGRLTDVLYNASVYKDVAGKVLGVFAAARDVTVQKQAEEDLRKYKDHLEEEVQLRTADLVLARNAAEAANRAKSVFLSSMSHELRTPLNAILGFSSMMRKDPLLQQDHRENLDIINRSGEHLLTLINDVLEMAKIEAGRVQLERAPFDLGGLVRDVTDMMHMRAQQKGLRLLIDQSSEFPRYIKGDEARVRQVLINLLGNAVKFTEQGGVTVRFGLKPHATPPRLLIEVEDSGIGIKPTDQQRIFEPFVQLGKTAAQKGTGLGLTITRQFVQLLGGAISVESTPGVGSTFRVELPVEKVAAADVLRPESVARGEVVGLVPGQPEYRILIVEDQLENQLLLARLMQSVGFPVKVAENGEQGVQLFQSWRPHLIWMDRRMPVMDGLEATRRIRALPGGTEVKIVAVTASAFTEQRVEMLDGGMDDFVRKPYRFNEIYETLSKQLGVQYTYADAQAAEEVSDAVLTAQMLAALPPELRRELHDALESLENERISAVIGQVESQDAKLHKALAHLAENYDYPAILKALQIN